MVIIKNSGWFPNQRNCCISGKYSKKILIGRYKDIKKTLIGTLEGNYRVIFEDFFRYCEKEEAAGKSIRASFNKLMLENKVYFTLNAKEQNPTIAPVRASLLPLIMPETWYKDAIESIKAFVKLSLLWYMDTLENINKEIVKKRLSLASEIIPIVKKFYPTTPTDVIHRLIKIGHLNPELLQNSKSTFRIDTLIQEVNGLGAPKIIEINTNSEAGHALFLGLSELLKEIYSGYKSLNLITSPLDGEIQTLDEKGVTLILLDPTDMILNGERERLLRAIKSSGKPAIYIPIMVFKNGQRTPTLHENICITDDMEVIVTAKPSEEFSLFTPQFFSISGKNIPITSVYTGPWVGPGGWTNSIKVGGTLEINELAAKGKIQTIDSPSWSLLEDRAIIMEVLEYGGLFLDENKLEKIKEVIPLTFPLKDKNSYTKVVSEYENFIIKKTGKHAGNSVILDKNEVLKILREDKNLSTTIAQERITTPLATAVPNYLENQPENFIGVIPVAFDFNPYIYIYSKNGKIVEVNDYGILVRAATGPKEPTNISVRGMGLDAGFYKN